MNLSLKNTMVIANNRPELAYMLAWCKSHGIKTCRFDADRWKDFPIAINPYDGAWTDHMNRALRYIDFDYFVCTADQPAEKAEAAFCEDCAYWQLQEANYCPGCGRALT